MCVNTDTGGKRFKNNEHFIEVPPGNYMAGDFGVAMTNYFSNKGNGLEYIVCKVSSNYENYFSCS